MQNRIVYIDALRGFAILLVIVGHLIQFNYSSGIENPIFNIIYSFHMPLFFFISGYVHSFSKKYTPLSFIKKKSKTFNSSSYYMDMHCSRIFFL